MSRFPFFAWSYGRTKTCAYSSWIVKLCSMFSFNIHTQRFRDLNSFSIHNLLQQQQMSKEISQPILTGSSGARHFFISFTLSILLFNCFYSYCIKCYENVFANNCDECSKIIGIDSKVRLRPSSFNLACKR